MKCFVCEQEGHGAADCPITPPPVTLADVVRQYRSEHNVCADDEEGCPCETCEAAKVALLAAGEPLEDLS